MQSFSGTGSPDYTNDMEMIHDAQEKNGSRGGKKPVMLYIFPSASSFVKNDTDAFNESFTLKTFTFQPKHKILLPFTLIREKLFLLKNITSTSILVCQFAGYHSLLPVISGRIFRRPCCIVVGGTDCVSMPSVNYGNLRKPLLRWFTLTSLRLAAHIISPGESLIKCNYSYMASDFSGQGYLFFDPSIKTPYTVIYNGVDISRFNIIDSVSRRKYSFLTLCTTLDRRNYRLKGIDLFVRAAELFPEFEFTIIGRLASGFDFKRPANVTLLGFVEHELLAAKMNEYSFYCQLSMSEGFGVALAEAMACGCVPIVSRVGIMDFITGDTGFVLDRYDDDLLKSVITKAVRSDIKELGKAARQRVIDNFTLGSRKSQLLKLLQKLIDR